MRNTPCSCRELAPADAPAESRRAATRACQLLVLLALFAPAAAVATPHTPPEWQRVVDSHANPVFVGQRKHTTWNRDLNRNFIDDEIEARFKPGDLVDVTVDLNRCVIPEDVGRMFSRFGTVSHVGRLVTFVLLDRVKFTDLSDLAARPDVAMVEWRPPVVPEIDTVSRAIQARSSTAFAGQSAQDLNLTGAGINIAIVDGGVDDGAASAFEGLRNVTFVAGFDATDPTDPGDGTRNPPQVAGSNHGTVMADIALGRPALGHACRNPNDPAATPDCRGIASGAGLVDVKICHPDATGRPTCDATEKAFDWIGTHAEQFKIRVVNYSFTRCGDDNGTGALAQQANSLAALGLVVLASYGNAPDTSAGCATVTPIGGRITKAPASGSFVIAVTGSHDANTVPRTDDAVLTNHFVGPRSDWSFMIPNLSALKPDLAAPQGAPVNSPNAPNGGLTLFMSGTTSLPGVAGTSPATAVASGAAALLLQKFPAMDPDSIKQALIASADRSRNTPFSTMPGPSGSWDSSLGWGLLNVGAAVNASLAQASNPRFFNCKTPSAAGGGQLCDLRDGQPVWLNTADIDATTSPQVNHQTTIRAHVINEGNNAATFLVHFGVYVFAVGNNQFLHIGTKQVTLGPNADDWVPMDWTPQAVNHQCIQVSIASVLDTDYTDNVTQRNFQVLPSRYTVRVENPLFVPARLELEAKSRKAGWSCRVSDPTFALDPFRDCARDVTITFDAPPGTRAGQKADCDVAVYATPQNGEKRRLIGGVTVRTYVPRPCRAWGDVVDADGRPVAGARVRVTPVAEDKGEAHGRAVSATTDHDGVFSVTIAPGARQAFQVEKNGRKLGSVVLRPGCGLDLPRLVASRDGLHVQSVRYASGPD